MTPAFPDDPVFVCVTTCAAMSASPVIDCQTNRNWSLVPVMSAPPATMLHVPVFGSKN